LFIILCRLGEAASLFPPNMTHTSRDVLKWACVQNA
jgi:hypothetical protein